MPSDSSTALIDYWRGVELLSPQPLGKVEEGDERVSRVEVGVPLPWHSAHPLHALWLGEKQAWRHLVFLGVYSLDRAFGDVRRAYPADEQMPAERPRAGESALAAFVVADDGRAILASPVLASCAWAIGQALREGPASVGTASFERVSSAFRAEWEGEVAAAAEDERARELEAEGWFVGAELEVEALDGCLDLVARLLELDQLHEDAELRRAEEIRIVSRKVPARERYAAGDRELLNSFYAEDLRKVGRAVEQGACGRALREYLKPANRVDVGARLDVERDLKDVRRALSPRRIPLGRWPSASANVPSLGQQLALNEISADRERGVWAVNGPPGTGKTVMLRDLLAALVVERAKKMAELDPREAFAEPLPWRGRSVHPPVAELCGYEVVLACATNAAAENVSAEIPSAEAIDSQWQGKCDYFPEIATKMLTPPDCDPPREAWAMVAGVLGNRSKNKAFVSRFWWEGMRDVLERVESGSESAGAAPTWEQAVARFREALARVESSQAERAGYSDLLDEREDAVAEWMAERIHADSARGDLEEIEPELVVLREAAGVAASAVTRCGKALRAHGHARPSLVERVRTLGGAMRIWRLQRARLNTALESAEQAAGETRASLAPIEAQTTELVASVERHESARSAAEARAREIQVELPGARERWEAEFPEALPADDRWAELSERERRERCAPWIDGDYNAARVDLFLAALALHRAFIEAAAPKMRASLRCATELISGQAGSEVSPQAARAAWQCLFLAVPLVSTTFASFPYVFRHLGQQALGWLLIDEAGQAAPQAAVGAIWRVRRTVVVGDPLQLEPIVQLPGSIERVLRAEHGVDHGWLRSDPSVQTLADQVCPLGTYRGREDGSQSVWVGIPLNVHRRCEAPMFEIVNEIAYGGQMLNCTPDRGELRLAGSHWIDVPGAPSSGNWVAAEGDALEELLAGLRYEMVDFSEVFVISPFRAVARNLVKYRKRYPGLTAGTIHTAQGREADVVILVLGGDARRPGARAWAAEKPNLLNVAVSRARRRLYVIGDRRAWAGLAHFETLAASLPLLSTTGLLSSAQSPIGGRRLL
ncbi:MAG TPA: AAA domain-containing protein [Solirubrobacteraceae bacterium]|jgi:hypothetical protein|nr:AAA domain-containing protein [Solirubrobacteraceae bacterium]